MHVLRASASALYVDTTGKQVLPSWSGVVFSARDFWLLSNRSVGRLFSLVFVFPVFLSQYDIAAYARTIFLCDTSSDPEALDHSSM